MRKITKFLEFTAAVLTYFAVIALLFTYIDITAKVFKLPILIKALLVVLIDGPLVVLFIYSMKHVLFDNE